jgi:hypothetical protein
MMLQLRDGVSAADTDYGMALLDEDSGQYWNLNPTAALALRTLLDGGTTAHEFGHAIGLGHNDDRSKLMCGRPAPCRPNIYRSDAERFFPLMEEEKHILLKLYPPTWRDVQRGTGSMSGRPRKVRTAGEHRSKASARKWI